MRSALASPLVLAVAAVVWLYAAATRRRLLSVPPRHTGRPWQSSLWPRAAWLQWSGSSRA